MAANQEDRTVTTDDGQEQRTESLNAVGQPYSVQGSVLGFLDSTLTDAVHVTGHVASEIVYTTARVVGDVGDGLTQMAWRGLPGNRS